MRPNLMWLLLCVVAVFGVATVAQAERRTRDGTPAVVKADGVVVAGLFRRIFDGKRCGPGGCPAPDNEPDVPDDPPPVEKVEPVQPEKTTPGKGMPVWGWFVGVAAGAAGFAVKVIKSALRG